ncbi:MAG: hypothetical protein ACTSPE_00765 [Candidatus Thorarchaeota archaeon]
MSEKSFRARRPSPLVTIRSLTSDIEGPIRVIGLVIEARPGTAIVQDLMDDVDNAGSIQVIVEGQLEVEHKYILIGEVTEKKTDHGKTLILNAEIAHDITDLDIREFKRTLDLEREVHSYLVR